MGLSSCRGNQWGLEWSNSWEGRKKNLVGFMSPNIFQLPSLCLARCGRNSCLFHCNSHSKIVSNTLSQLYWSLCEINYFACMPILEIKASKLSSILSDDINVKNVFLTSPSQNMCYYHIIISPGCWCVLGDRIVLESFLLRWMWYGNRFQIFIFFLRVLLSLPNTAKCWYYRI